MMWQVLPVFGLVACKGSMNIPLPILSRYPDVSFMYWTAFVYVWFQSSAWTNLHVERPVVCVRASVLMCVWYSFTHVSRRVISSQVVKYNLNLYTSMCM
jgi:hypothetical protein